MFIYKKQFAQCLLIINHFFLCHEAKGNVKINVQSCLIADDQQKHFIFVDFVCRVHGENFVIFQSQALRTVANNEQINEMIVYICFILINSVFVIQLV